MREVDKPAWLIGICLVALAGLTVAIWRFWS